MKVFLIVLGLGVVAISCSSFSPGCIVESQGIKIVSNAIVTNLQCTNSAAVQASVKAGFDKLGVCKNASSEDAKEGVIADAVCPAVSQYIAGFVADKTIPAAWGCNATAVKTAAAVAIEKACKLIPLSEKDKI